MKDAKSAKKITHPNVYPATPDTICRTKPATCVRPSSKTVRSVQQMHLVLNVLLATSLTATIVVLYVLIILTGVGYVPSQGVLTVAETIS